MSTPAGPEINPFAAPKSPEEPSTTSESAYKPLGSRAQAVTIALGFWCFLCVAAWAAIWTVMNTVASAGNTPLSMPDMLWALRLIVSARALGFLACVVCVGFYLPQANRNSRALRPDALMTFSPASTVWWFFVPLLNLIRPYEAVKEIWQATDSPAEGILKAFVAETPWYLPAWWGAWIGYNVVRQVQVMLKLGTEGAIIADGLSVAAAVLLIVIVRRMDARQVELHSRMHSAPGVS